jgi:hypothetical protein
MKNHHILLGDLAEDTITGYKGVVVAVTDWLNGCRRLTLQAKELTKDGKPVESYTVDSEDALLLKAKKRTSSVPAGGPRPDPVRTR